MQDDDDNELMKEAEKAVAEERWVDALHCYSILIQKNPPSALLFYNRGNVYVELRENDKAIADYTSAASLGNATFLAVCRT